MTKEKELEFERKLDNLTKTTDRILSYIETDGRTGRVGIFEQQNKNIVRIEELEDCVNAVKNNIKTDKKVLTKQIGVGVAFFSAIGWIVLELFKTFRK